MTKQYYYTAYGLNIESDITLDGLAESSEIYENIDVRIIIGKVPDEVPDLADSDYICHTINKDFYLFVKDFARYYIKNGEEIIIEPSENITIEDAKVFVYGTCLGVCLIVKKILPIHCSAVEINGKSVLFVGDAGAGKSTIAIGLRGKGFRVIADDVIAVREEGGRYLACSGLRQQKISSDMAKHFNVDVSSLKRINLIDEREKYFLPLEDAYAADWLPIGSVIELAVGEDMLLEEVAGTKGLEILLRNTYRPMLIQPLGFAEGQFKSCSGIVKQAKIYRMTRPQNIITVEEELELIIDTFAGKEVSDG